MAYTLLGKAPIEGHLRKWDRSADISSVFTGLPQSNAIWADDEWEGKNQWKLKVSLLNLNQIAKKFNQTPSAKGEFHIDLSGIRMKIIKSGLVPGKARSIVAGGRSETKMQEDGSMYIMKHALQNRKKPWPSLQAYLDDPEVEAILDEHYPSAGKKWEEWRETYYKQSETILKVASGEKWTEFSRDEGFMEWISDLVKTRFKISQKDTWNPADIWLIHNERSTMKYIEESIGKVGTVEQLNVAMRNLFNLNILPNESVMGISLKKISGVTAKWQIYNMTTADGKRVAGTFDPAATVYPIHRISLGLHMKPNRAWGGMPMTTIFSTIFLGNQTDDRITIDIGRHPKGFADMKFEGEDHFARAAKLGKCPVQEAVSVFAAHGLNHQKTHKAYPQTEEEFLREKYVYKQMLSSLATRQEVALGLGDLTVDGALDNIQAQFNTEDPGRANSKCQQIDLIYRCYLRGKVDRIWTDIAFHAQKIGDKYGPFGKLY